MNRNSILIIFFFVGLLASAIKPHDYFTWFLEVFPAIIGLALLTATYKKAPFSSMVYYLVLIHCCILFVGGHYTYAEVPLFDWIKETFGQSRNNYDKVGHFAQGFIPAAIVREVFIRKTVVKRGFWLSFLTMCLCITISVFYEFLEWAVAVWTGAGAEAFLGTQGYAWDTQSDMLMCTIGAVSFLILCSKIQDKQIQNSAAWQKV
jgi:putative membrane protein